MRFKNHFSNSLHNGNVESKSILSIQEGVCFVSRSLPFAPSTIVLVFFFEFEEVYAFVLPILTESVALSLVYLFEA
jgi:hypothetical protein